MKNVQSVGIHLREAVQFSDNNGVATVHWRLLVHSLVSRLFGRKGGRTECSPKRQVISLLLTEAGSIIHCSPRMAIRLATLVKCWVVTVQTPGQKHKVKERVIYDFTRNNVLFRVVTFPVINYPSLRIRVFSSAVTLFLRVTTQPRCLRVVNSSRIYKQEYLQWQKLTVDGEVTMCKHNWRVFHLESVNRIICSDKILP